MQSHMKKLTSILYVVVGVVLIGAGLFIQKKFKSEPSDSKEEARSVKIAKKGEDGKKASNPAARPRKRKTERARVSNADEDRKKERPNFDDIMESELTKLQASVLRELKDALDDDNLQRVRKAVAKFNLPKSAGGLGGEVPKVMRSRAVSALGWFGSSAAYDLMEFMADVDPEIEEEAFSSFEQALDDWDISDRERARALNALMTALHDTERIDSMLMALNNMRNSVKGEAIISILSSGTPEAKALMQEQLEFYTDFDIFDANGVSEWIKNNPDNEWDEEFYGANKD